MNKLCKQYVRNVKSFFPIIGKKERKYFKTFALNVEDYCAENAVSSLDELYHDFGTPAEVVNNYYSAIDTTYIVKQIKITKAIKLFFFSLFVIAFITASIYCGFLYSVHKTFKAQQIFFEETFIE